MKHPVPRPLLPLLTLWLAAGLAPSAGADQEPPLSEPPAAEVAAAVESPAPDSPTRPGHRSVRSLRPLVPAAGRVAWSTQGDRIAFDRAGADGQRQIWVATVGRTETTGERCLSCDIHEWRNANVLDPVWHPSGELLVVQVQRLRRRPEQDPLALTGPQRAVASELWTLPLEGRQVFRLTPEGANLTAPFVSYEADRLLWTERLRAGDRKTAGPWGWWGVRVADLKVRRGIPRVGRVRTHEAAAPGPVLAQGFTPDDRGLLVERDGRIERWSLDHKSATVTTLAAADRGRFGPARYGPTSDRLAWAASRGLEDPQPGLALPYRSDLWLAVGSPAGAYREERLTSFNDPASDHFLGAALIGDLAWSPGGDRIALQVLSAAPGGRVDEALWLLTLDLP